MKLNKGWRLFYTKDSQYNGDIKSVKGLSCFADVSVPTLFELEIYRNGLLGHPYESTNSWDYQQYEDYHQFYVLNFKTDKKYQYIRFDGVDTISEIYLNGKLIGRTDNMFLPYVFKLDNLQDDNELIVHILPCVVEGRKREYDLKKVYAFKYNYEGLYIRKTASSFGWDILPRTPLGGIYKDIHLIESLPILNDVQIKATNISKVSADLQFNLDLDKKYSYSIDGKCEDNEFHLKNENKIVIKNPKLWNIRGYGKPYLYDITINIYLNNDLVETKTIKYGIRKVELFRSSTVREGGCFEYHINDEKVFLLGCNWVPIEAIKHIDDERMLKALDMVTDLGCNSIRIWGGGTYESDFFYEKCDELGIFIWQDFMMGCGVYPMDDEFLGKMTEEVTYVVKHLRNHASLCIWAGDNENDLAAAFFSRGIMKPNDNVITRKLIPDILEQEDGTRPYLPSSPYIDEYAEEHIKDPLSEDHLWGPRDYFKGEFYNHAVCYFTSETGYHGMANLSSTIKFIHHPWPIFDGKIIKKDSNSRIISDETRVTKEYLCHCVSVVDDYDSPWTYRSVLMANQVYTLFTNEINNLEDFTLGSQISQAEAYKHFIERMRKDYSRNGGIIWWNLIDGWPQPSDAIVDYYFGKKISYDYIKRSQQANLIMLYEDNDELQMYIVSSDAKPHKLSYQIIDAYSHTLVEEGTIETKPRNSYKAKTVKADDKTLLVIKYKDEEGNEYWNHFHTHIIDIDLYKYRDAMKEYNLIKER